MPQKLALVPSYYSSFKCIGPECEDSCCIGWQVDIDKDTYQHYKQNQHKALVKLFKEAVKRNPNSLKKERYGIISMTPDGRCTFLDQDNLCNIQKNLGAQALSATCANYPRIANRFGAQLEYSLGLSCPEAARLILLNPAPVRFTTIDTDPNLSRPGAIHTQIPEKNEGNPEKVAILNDLRALSIGILQHRELSIEARLMLLGLLMEKAQTELGTNFEFIIEKLPAVIEQFTEILAHSKAIQNEFDKIEANHSLKLQVFSDILGSLGSKDVRFKECLTQALRGLALNNEALQSDQKLIEQHIATYKTFYAPFFDANSHIFENYLVHYVFHSLFPLRNSDLLMQFREMISNYLIAHIFLLGMSAFNRGLTEGLVIQFFQSFNRRSAHNANYLSNVLKVLEKQKISSFQHLLLLIKN